VARPLAAASLINRNFLPELFLPFCKQSAACANRE